MRFFHLFTFLLLFSSHSALAAITINEVAWMGDSDSTNHEWIELHNTDSLSVSIDGWMLEDGVNLSMDLSGTVPAFGYAVLERSSDDSAPGPAFLIYVGALVNTGATLVLRDAGGQIVDQVPGGENWENIGGDNVTKETAQYTSGGWVTDVPTPGKKNSSGRVVAEEIVEEIVDSAPSTKKSSGGSKKKETVKLTTPDTVLELNTDIQTVAYVNQEIPLSVTGSGISKHIVNSLKYDWNFGDTNTASGPDVKYSYAYPGTYVVTVRAAYARHDQVARHEITILPVTFSVTRNDVGDIQIHNDSPYDVDASGYVVRGEKRVVFPPRTIILPRSTITIPKEKVGSEVGNMVAIYDTEHTMLASTYKTIAFASRAVSDEVSSPYTEPPSEFMILSSLTPKSNAVFEFSSDNDNNVVVADTDINFMPDVYPTTTVIDNELVPMENVEEKPIKPNSGNSDWPYIAFVGLLTVAFVGLYLGRGSSNKT